MRKIPPENRLGNAPILDLGEVEDRAQLKALAKLLVEKSLKPIE
jgi:hypothetical protein